MPDGFESVMLSCKTIYAAGKSLLPRHNLLRRTFKRTVLDPDLKAAIPLLLRITRDPLIAEYVEDLDLWNFAHSPLSVETMPDSEMGNVNASEQFSSLLLRHASFEGLDNDPSFWLWELSGHFPFDIARKQASIILLAILPNLRSLTPALQWEDNYVFSDETAADVGEELEGYAQWWKCLRNLTACASRPYSEARPFANLELVKPFCQPGHEDGVSLQRLEGFFTVPTVGRMDFCSCHALARPDMGSSPFKWADPAVNSSIEHLELAYSCIDGPSIGALVLHMPKLRTLRYSHDARRYRGTQEWNIRDFITHVGRGCGNTLIDLSVTTIGPDEGANGTGSSLKLFNCLERLELDLCSLGIYNSVMDNPGSLQDPQLPCASTTGEKPGFTLAALLPKSLKSLRLIVQSTSREYDVLRELLLNGSESFLDEQLHLEHLKVCRALDARSCDERNNSLDALWQSLRELAPMKYFYRSMPRAQATWHAEFFQRYPYMDWGRE